MGILLFINPLFLFRYITDHSDVVDLGGSLAVASRGLFATGVSTDLNGAWTGSIEDDAKWVLTTSQIQ